MQGFDELWPGGPRFKQGENSFKLSTDSVLLGDFVNMKRVKKCLDLGCGAGVLTVLMAHKGPDAHIKGIEIQEDWAKLCEENLKENGFSSRTEIICGDIKEHKSLVTAGEFDLVVSNPPYFPVNSGYSAPGKERATAREEKDCTLQDICRAAKWALRWGGAFAMVHRPERLSEIFCAMTEAGIEPKRLRMVSYSPFKAPNLILVEGKRGAKKGLTIEKSLILTDENGKDSEEVMKIYKRGPFSPNVEI